MDVMNVQPNGEEFRKMNGCMFEWCCLILGTL